MNRNKVLMLFGFLVAVMVVGITIATIQYGDEVSDSHGKAIDSITSPQTNPHGFEIIANYNSTITSIGTVANATNSSMVNTIQVLYANKTPINSFAITNNNGLLTIANGIINLSGGQSYFITASNNGSGYARGDYATTPAFNITGTGINWTAGVENTDSPSQVRGWNIANVTTRRLTTTVTTLLNSPANNSFHIAPSVIFNMSVLPELSNITNVSSRIWFDNGTLFNETTNTLTGAVRNSTTVNISSFIPERYIWNAQGCVNNGTTDNCEYASQNVSFTYGYQVDNEFFNNLSVEGNTEQFQINVTLSSGIGVDIGTLVYNNTNYSGTITNTAGDSFSLIRTLEIPDVDFDVNNSFYWDFILDTGFRFNSTQFNQQVSNLTIDNCAVNDLLILNYTLKDEGTQINLTAGDNGTISVDVDISPIGTTTPIIEFSGNFTNQARVCLASGSLPVGTEYRMDVVTSYDSDNHVNEFHHIQNSTLSNTSSFTDISLYDLKTVDSQSFLITYKDNNFIPVEDALIDVTRKYVEDGVFRSVEVPKTDEDGETIAHLLLEDAIYTFIVKKDGVVLATFSDMVAVCQNQANNQCTINLNSFSSGTEPTDFTTVGDISFGLSFNEPTRTITGTYTILSGASATVQLNATLFDSLGNTTVCSDTLVSSSGTLTCLVPQSYGNATVEARLYKDGTPVGYGFFTILQDASETFGYTGILMLAILFITLPLMLITTGVGIIIGATIGLVMAGLLNLYNGGSIFGATSTIIWFIVASGIIIWKIQQRRNQG